MISSYRELPRPHTPDRTRIYGKEGSRMSMTGRRRRFIINTAYFAVIVGIVFLVFRYLLNLIWPFFVAFLFASLLTPVIRWLTVHCRLKYNLASALCLIVFFALLGGVAFLITSRVITLIADTVTWLPTLYNDTIYPGLENLSNSLEELAERVSPEVADTVESALPTVISSIGSTVTSASMRLVSSLSGWAAKLPSRLISTLICFIATIFMTLDYHRMTAFLLRQVPERSRHVISEARTTLGQVIRKYGRSYAIIMGITFLEMLVGLLILRQKNALLIAVAIAVFDIFPIVGAGTILVPWAVVSLLGGDVGKGVGLIVIWVVEIVVRQIMEPRIVGRQVGLHPLITLIAMFVGSKLFGGVGLLGLPITCAIVSSMDQAGVIHIIKRENAPQPATPDEPSRPADRGGVSKK